MFLHDKPESSDIRFGHTIVSNWLADEIKKAQTPIRLALTGELGTGKSTILKFALDTLTKEDSNIKIAYVDVWKLDKESVRRSAILKIAKDLRPDDYKTIEEIKESAYGTRVENAKPKLFNIYWSKPGIFFAIFIGLIIYAITMKTFDILASGTQAGGVPAIKHAISLVVAFLGVLFKLLDKSIINIQKTISKAPMVGAEEFEECLEAILSSPKLKKSKTILVFDNIDRASPASSRAILSGISAFFDHSEKNANVIIIVPFDPSCLRGDVNGERPLLDDCEKMFDAIIPLPKLTSEDLSDFALDHLKKSLTGFTYTEEQLQDLAYLVSFSPYRSPREIKHMVNQLMSRLNLAKSLETKKDLRLQTDSTLLPAGAITTHPECLLKFLICEKIYPRFTETLVTQGLDVAKTFEADPNSALMKSLDRQTTISLTEFLHATMGIPKTPPQSAAAFLYMKGPDQVLTIPSGQAISDAIYMGDGEKLKNVIFPLNSNPVSHKDIASVIQYHRKKYAKNTQALKNSTRAITVGMTNVVKFEKPLSLEFCEVLNLIPEVLINISPNWLDSVTNEYLEVSSVSKVWKTADSEFKKLITSEEDISKDNVTKWLVEYFVSVYNQNGGKERSNLNGIKLPLNVLIDEAIYEVLGEDYPSVFASDESTLIAVKSYFSKDEKMYHSFVSQRFSHCRNKDGIEIVFSEIAELWKSSVDIWLNSKDADFDGNKFSNVAYYWPTKSEKALPYMVQLKDWVVSQAGRFNQKSNAGFSVDVIDICIAFYANALPADGNINGIINHSLSVINEKGLNTLFSRYNNPNSVWKLLAPHSTHQLVQAFDRNNYFKDALNIESPLLRNITANFANFNSKNALLDALLDIEVIPVILEDINTYYNSCNSDLRPKLIKLLIKYQVEESILKQVLDLFVATPDEANSNVITEVENLSDSIKKHSTDIAINFLNTNINPWTEKEVRILEWVHLAIEEVLDANLKDFLDRVIDRGSQNGISDIVRKNCTDHVLKMWEKDHGFSEKSFKILKKSAHSEFDERLFFLAKRHNIQESFLEKAGNALEKVLGLEESEE